MAGVLLRKKCTISTLSQVIAEEQKIVSFVLCCKVLKDCVSVVQKTDFEIFYSLTTFMYS